MEAMGVFWCLERLDMARVAIGTRSMPRRCTPPREASREGRGHIPFSRWQGAHEQSGQKAGRGGLGPNDEMLAKPRAQVGTSSGPVQRLQSRALLAGAQRTRPVSHTLAREGTAQVLVS